MKIQSINQSSVLKLLHIQSERHYLPSISLSVSVADSGFCGENPEVWFEADEVSRFVTAVQKLDRERKGSAKLSSMSPDECLLAIISVDRSGHLVLEYQLSSQVYLEHSSQKRLVSGGFDLNPTDLERMHKFFSALAAV
ncbi:WapI family immunity protein [Paenibacillus luteus]|uniref:WapI family immunity protein n=1 Tax=Paenibacillus luteus TaxID=2545753 RepID=UPI001141A303|nr:hypothetical protein [Paenibacillus luteus]